MWHLVGKTRGQNDKNPPAQLASAISVEKNRARSADVLLKKLLTQELTAQDQKLQQATAQAASAVKEELAPSITAASQEAQRASAALAAERAARSLTEESLRGQIEQERAKGRRLVSDLGTLETKFDRLEQSLLQSSGDSTVRHQLASGTLGTHTSKLSSAGACMSGNIHANVGFDIAAHTVPITLGTLNAAAANTPLAAVEIKISQRQWVDGVSDWLTTHGLNFHPKFTPAESVADVDVGAPAVYDAYGTPASLTGVWTWDASTTVVMSGGGDMAEVKVGDAIRDDVDGVLYEIIKKNASDVLIANPHSYTIPSGAAGSSVGALPMFRDGILTLVPVPDTDAGATKVYADPDSMTITVDVTAGTMMSGITPAIPDFVLTIDVTA